MSQADRGTPSRASDRCSILCTGENFTDFHVTACDEAAGMFGLVGRELETGTTLRPVVPSLEVAHPASVAVTAGGKHQGVEATPGAASQATYSDRDRIHRELAEYLKQQSWMWLWLKRSTTKSFTTDVKVDSRSPKILADRDPLQLYLLLKTISLERTSLNAELLHDRLKAIRVISGEKVNNFVERLQRAMAAYESGTGKALLDHEKVYLLQDMVNGSSWEDHIPDLYAHIHPDPKAPTLASLFRQLNNLERNKKLGHKGKPTADRRRPNEHEKVLARAFLATSTPSPAQRGKPVSTVRTNKTQQSAASWADLS
ncbi:hypothetical protein B484DRAFT_410732 [Ochromonadaceae sp. CCMP2298]|nr:hypothetical protein B484DRAFT_410732 [Ochromonadaceae sp. CCMP2298]